MGFMILFLFDLDMKEFRSVGKCEVAGKRREILHDERVIGRGGERKWEVKYDRRNRNRNRI